MRQEVRTDPWRVKLLVACLVVGGLFIAAAAAGVYHVSAPVLAFYVLALIEAGFIMRPVDPTNIVSRERQQNTLEPLLITPLTPARFLRGHLLFQLAVAGRRMCAMLPLFAAVYLLGGFALRQFLIYQVLLLVYLVAANSTLMALANSQPQNPEGGAGILPARRRGQRSGPAAVINPATMLAYVLFPLLFVATNLAIRGSLVQVLATAGTPGAPPHWDLFRLFGLVHPFLTLLLWGDTMVFGHPVPLWAAASLFWLLVAQASCFTFVHQMTMRKFRLDQGYRFGRFVLFTGFLFLAAALMWRLGPWALLVCAAVTGFYALVRFGNPLGVPLSDNERWEILPRRDIFVHRAGNLFPFFLVLMLPAWGIQSLLVSWNFLPGLARATFYANAELFFAVAALLLSGQIIQMKRIRRERQSKPTGDLPPPSAPEADAAEREKAKRPGAPAPNPAAAPIFLLWLVPLVLLGLAPLLKVTPAAPLAAAAVRLFEPLHLVNPVLFEYRLLSGNQDAFFQGNPLELEGTPAFPSLVPGSGLDYYRMSLAAGGFILLLLLCTYGMLARQLARPRPNPGQEPHQPD